MTKLKSKIVNRKNLCKIGEEIGIREVLLYNNSRSINISTLEGNAFEALIGAIYLDGGYVKTKKIIEKYIFKRYLNFKLNTNTDLFSFLYLSDFLRIA